MLFPAYRRNESLSATGFQMTLNIFCKNLQGTQLALEAQFEGQTLNCPLAEAVM